VKKTFAFLVLIVLGGASLYAQQLNEPDFLEQEYLKESLRAQALDDFAAGKYREALSHLDAALALDPEDRDLSDLRESLLDIIILEEGRSLEEQTEENTEEPGFSEFNREDEDVVISPDFASDLLTEAQSAHPERTRPAFYATLGASMGNTKPIRFDANDNFTSDEATPTHPFGRIHSEFSYFFNRGQRNIGFSTRYKAVAFNEDDVDALEHQVDFTLNLQAYFSETMENRLILGARAGFGLVLVRQDDDDGGRGLDNANVFIAGFYLEDALFRYMFKESSLFKRVIFNLGFDFYFVSDSEYTELTEYNFGLGYRFDDHWTLSFFTEALNTSSSLEGSDSFEAGLKLRYLY
jgi:hypothetical protein